MKIAALITSYNRKEKTLSCLQSLQSQILKDIDLQIYLTDDNSSDGTSQAVKEQFPGVHIFKGTGMLFWAGGMRYTWKKALEADPDYFLLVNDDNVLTKDAIERLLDCTNSFDKPIICVGSTCGVENGKISYGGSILLNPNRPQSRIVFSENEMLECDLGNANVMLVHSDIVKSIGILAEDYTHGIADYDYTMQAKRAGFKVIVAPGILGKCIDDHGNNWKSSNSSLKERILYLYSPKGLAYREYLIYIKRFFPFHTPSAIVKLWLKTFFPSLWDRFKQAQ